MRSARGAIANCVRTVSRWLAYPAVALVFTSAVGVFRHDEIFLTA